MFVARLLDTLFPPRGSELLVRNATYDTLAEVLSPSLLPQHEHAIISLLPYQEPLVQACIVEAKFHNNKKASELLSHTLSDYLLEALSDTSSLTRAPTVLIPMPLSTKRRRERGYNQVERALEGLILPEETLVSIDTALLTRTRDTAPQTTLPKHARAENVREAFSVGAHIDTECTFIVLDDVCTTGATLSEALRALTRAGAKKVSGLTLAH